MIIPFTSLLDFPVELGGDFPDFREDEFSSLKPDWL